MHHTETDLKRLQQHGVCLNKEKSRFLQPEVEFLGFQIMS